MSHEIEFTNGKANLAYAGETPWHSLGTEVSNDLLPVDMLQKAGLDWEVNKMPTYIQVGDDLVETGSQALVRSSDNKILTTVSDKWEPVQNAEAFGFFHDFVMEGDMEMHTAGSLKGGNMVFALAKIKKSFKVGRKDDEVNSFLLFSNPHEYGKCIDIRFTPVRVVCNNTLSMALRGKTDMMVRLNHTRKFDSELVKESLNLASKRMDAYADAANFLASKEVSDEKVHEYISKVFPIVGENKRKEDYSKPAREAIACVNSQPGADLAEGTMWNAFNAVTFYTDHIAGRSDDTRMSSAWYGANRQRKIDALKLAMEYAEAA